MPAHGDGVRHRSRWLLLASIAGLVVVIVGLVLVRGDEEASTAGSTTTTTTTTTVASTSSTSGADPSTTATTAPVTPSTPPPPTDTSPTTIPPGAGPAEIVRRGPAGNRIVALTFDAGSDVGYAAAILDTLAANGIRATFGLTGRWATDHPDLVARMAREGHQLVNHTWSHPSFTGTSTQAGPLPTAERLAELARAEQAILDASGIAARPWFRPPYGDVDDSVLADVGTAGYRYVAMWTVDSLGWKGIAATEITDRCLTGAEPGAVYLFHVGAASADHAALQAIIDGLRGRGYGFATLAGLIGA